MNKERELLHNTIILGFGKLANYIAWFFLIPIATFSLSPSEFGIYDLIATYAVVLAPLLTLQLEMSVFRHLIDARGNTEQQASIITNAIQLLAMCILAIIPLLLCIDIFVRLPHLYLAVALVATTALNGFMLQLSRGIGRSTIFATSSIASAATSLVLACILVLQVKAGLPGLLISTIAANILSITLISIKVRVWRLFSLNHSSKDERVKLLKYSLPLIPNGLAVWIVNASDRTMIAILIDFSAAGIYAIASRFSLALSGLFGVFNMSWTEAVSVHLASTDKDRDSFISNAFNSGIKGVFSGGIVIVALVHIIAPLFVDRAFSGAFTYIPILIFGAILSAAMSMFGGIYIAKKMTTKVALTSIYAAVLNIALSLCTIPYFGLTGAAISTTLSFGTVVIVRHFDIKKYVNITYNIKNYTILMVAYIFISILYYVDNASLNIVSAILSVLFVCAMNRNELRAISLKLRRKFTQ